MASTSSSSCNKKRKVDVENRLFNAEWTDLYVFDEDHRVNKPVCLICLNTVAVNKTANVKRHHETRHQDFIGQFPLGSEKRKQKIRKLQDSRQMQLAALKTFTTTQKKSTEASLKISCVLAQAMVPYSFGLVIKECIQIAIDTLCSERKEIQQAVNDISLSRKTVTTRIEDMSSIIFSNLIASLKECDCYSLALDESTDQEDIAQLAVFVRFYNKQQSTFVEQLLRLIPLEQHTTGQVIYDKLTSCLREHGLPVERIVSVSTDGAPAMSGTVNGLAGRLARDNPHILFIHCIIHQAVLCAKLSGMYTLYNSTSSKVNVLAEIAMQL